MHRLPLIALMLLVLPIHAVEVQAPEPPGYLAMNFRAEWRSKPLAEILVEIQKAVERPIVTSPAVEAGLDSWRVTLVDDRKAQLRETLEHLETTQDLRFTAEPLRLRVESAAEVVARRRRPVDLDLAEYGIFARMRDFPGPDLSLRLMTGDNSGGLIGSGTAAEGGQEAGDMEGVVEWLKRLVDTGGIQARGRTALHMLATPEEEAALRKALGEALAQVVRRSSWRITWGLAKAGTTVPTGIVPVAEVGRLIQGLEQRSSDVLHAFAGQRVHGGRLRERSYVSDAEIISSRLDPVVSVLATGRMADLRPLTGASVSMLSYRLAWVDPGSMTEVPLNQPPVIEPGNVSVEVGKEGAASTVQTSAPVKVPGSQVTMQLPALWTWSPRGDVVLPPGSALVLCAEHPLGHAVIAIEEVR